MRATASATAGNKIAQNARKGGKKPRHTEATAEVVLVSTTTTKGNEARLRRRTEEAEARANEAQRRADEAQMRAEVAELQAVDTQRRSEVAEAFANAQIEQLTSAVNQAAAASAELQSRFAKLQQQHELLLGALRLNGAEQDEHRRAIDEKSARIEALVRQLADKDEQLDAANRQLADVRMRWEIDMELFGMSALLARLVSSSPLVPCSGTA